MKGILKIVLIFGIVLVPLKVEAGRGCCSHHGGVVGCSSNGKQVCADGSLSPSCTCIPPAIYGCTDRSASNYNSNANQNDGSCIYYVYGCTDKNAMNYNEKANKDDNSCEYEVLGCTDKNALNYNKEANKDDDSCKYHVPGCTDVEAKNYNSFATLDDGSCKYQKDLAVFNVEDDSSASDSDLGDVILGGGAIAGGVYLFKKKKNKR